MVMYNKKKKTKSNQQTRIILLVLAVVIVVLVGINRYRVKSAAVQEDITTLPVTIAPEAVEQKPQTVPATVPVEKPVEPAPAVQPATGQLTQPVTAPSSPEPNTAVVMDDSSPEAVAVVRRAVEDIKAGKIIAARDQLNRVLDMKLSDKVRQEVKTKLSELSGLWLFSKTVCPGDPLTEMHKVQPGERLAVLARQYKIPHECIEKINGITNPERMQAGQMIKIVHGPFSAVVSKKNFTLDLYLQGVFVKTYKVGLGRVEHETPSGKWRATAGGKMVSPTWTDPDTGKTYHGSDPDYPLGSRWIALEGLEGAARGRTGFAIHGTKEPETIGTRASRGCIRLYNGDVVEVYDLVEAGVSEVMVTD